MKETKYGFINYRCRKCGEIISAEANQNPAYITGPGVTFKSNFHDCKFGNGLEENESVYCDMVSFSDEPLASAYEIIYIDEDGKYKKYQENNDEMP